jgi:hypothetical protein
METLPRAHLSRYRIDLYQAGDEDGICRLFERVFRRRKPIAHWRWQFSDRPFAIHAVVARDGDGRIVGHFAGIPVRALVDGDAFTFTQIVDSMVDPACRAGLRNPGLFACIVDAYVERFGCVEQEAVSFGLPNREALRHGRRFSAYQVVREMRHLARPVPLFREPVGRGALRISVSSDLHAGHDGLWQIHAARHRMLTVRDRSHCEWRYVRCPTNSYAFVHVERGGRLAATLVFSARHFVEQCASVVDLVAGDDEEAIRAAVGAAEELARAAGRVHIAAFFPEASAEAALLEAMGYGWFRSGYTLVARSYHPPLTIESLREQWWYTLGDFDLA